MTDLLPLPKAVCEQNHQVIVWYEIFVSTYWTIEFNDNIVILIHFDLNDLCTYVSAVIFSSVIPSETYVVFFCDAFRAAAVLTPGIPVIALLHVVAFPITTGFYALSRGPQKHVVFVEVLAQLTPLYTI